MDSNDNLEQLKQNIRDKSNQQYQLQQQKIRTQKEVSYREQEKNENNQEMTEFIRSVFLQNEIANAKERELFKNSVDKFSHRQKIMNDQIIELNDNLTDVTALKAVYEAKRETLELDYQNQKDALQKQIHSLAERIETSKNDLKKIKNEIQDKQAKLDELNVKIKRATFLYEFKHTWVDKWLNLALVGFISLIIGGFFGWGIFSLIGSIFSAIRDFLGSIFVFR